MAMRITLDIQGITQSLEEVARLGMNIDEATKQALEVGGDILVEGMQRRVPVGKSPEDPHPGNLKAHLERTEPRQDGNYIFILVGMAEDIDADTARYGNAQEYGTSKMAAQPYIRPTMANDLRDARIAMNEKLMKIMKTRA